MKSLLIAFALALSAGCGDDTEFPGRDPSGPPPICQWKTPCLKEPAPAVVVPDGGAVHADGGVR